ncbi:unnamed protein product [Auanema sp. JU1783]|nr:unnamed protein product [Auanema sp. JU1783]
MGWNQLLRKFMSPGNKSELISSYMVLIGIALHSILFITVITYWLIRRQAVPRYTYVVEEIKPLTKGCVVYCISHYW